MHHWIKKFTSAACLILGCALSIDVAQANITTPFPGANTTQTVTNILNPLTHVSTFESIGLYWSPQAVPNQVCAVQYRIAGLGGAWNKAMNLWFDGRALAGRPAEYRGSIIGLISGTQYEIKTTLTDGTTYTILADTMNETFPIGEVVFLPKISNASLAITSGGTASAYKLYTFDPANGSAMIDVNKTADTDITVSAPYVIIRGLMLKGAKADGIRLVNGAHHVVIENNDISDWGSPIQFGGYATDGDKSSNNVATIPYGGPQWMQIDLGTSQDVTKVSLWHYWADSRTYHDVIVQVAEDAFFGSGVTTVFNNDTDNSSKLGAGSDAEYIESSAGKTIIFPPVRARYVRFWSNGYIRPGGAGGNATYAEVEAYAGSVNLALGKVPTFSYGAGLGVNNNGGIRGVYLDRTIKDIIIQRNKIHDPTYTNNSWDFDHPAGPSGIVFEQDGGGHNIFRYNEITTSNGNYYLDVMTGGENFSYGGMPGPDSDVYGNIATHAYDDGLEMEGGGMNVRVWGNYVDQTATGISSATVSLGPLYIFRNVYNKSHHLYYKPYPDNLKFVKRSLDQDDRLGFGKTGDNLGFGGGKRYVFHNTLLQTPQDPAQGQFPLGAGDGLDPSGSPPDGGITNTETRNNIFHIWKDASAGWWSIYDAPHSPTNSFDFDLHNGGIYAYAGAETNGILGKPIYAPNNGWISGAGGQYALDPSSPGYHTAVAMPNFNDSTSTPDIGAHQSNTPPMAFGVGVARNLIRDGDMSLADTVLWTPIGTPTLLEKKELGSNRRLHIIGNVGTGVAQEIKDFVPGVAYRYSIAVYLVSGKARAQLYQNGQQQQDLYRVATPGTGWQIFSGVYTPTSGTLTLRIFADDSVGLSEFYVDEAALQSTRIIPVNTASGSNINVAPVDAASGSQAVALSFASVSAGGITTTALGIAVPAPPATQSHCAQPVTFDAFTTTQYSGSVTVCADPAALGSTCGPNAALWHWNGSQWEKLAAPANAPAGKICGVSSTLSTFALFALTQTAQSITFNTIGNYTLGAAPFTVQAMSSSGLSVSIVSVAPQVCSAVANTVTLLTPGTCVLQASQAGDTNYKAAPLVVQSFNIAAMSTTANVDGDAPTLPQWAMLMLAAILMLSAMRRRVPGRIS